ncbi:phosphoribosyltransferase-like protein [Undibacterium sp. Ji49W]|uniref:phosphoribosyltransferase-like protein n=1 Tax=Undibacterium sp. Ji49W TaxID=3413040 RepID=UPI003BF38E8C
MSLGLDMLGRATQLWDSKKWEFPTTDEKNASFESFCEMLRQLPVSSQEFVLNLTSSYSVYSFTNYQSLLIDALSKLDDSHVDGIGHLIFAPLINPSDDKRGVAKSGHLLPYIARHVAAPLNPKLNDLKITQLVSLDMISNCIEGKENILVILLDDFIGSGDTAKNSAWKVMDFLRKNDKLLVVSLVAMRHAIQYLAKYRIDVISADVVTKGIEENLDLHNKAESYAIVDSIAADLDVGPDYVRGYKESEALVTMIRTPDNTFPMYWCTKKKVGKLDWPAPFPRK